jgi:hypothetical protein
VETWLKALAHCAVRYYSYQDVLKAIEVPLQGAELQIVSTKVLFVATACTNIIPTLQQTEDGKRFIVLGVTLWTPAALTECFVARETQAIHVEPRPTALFGYSEATVLADTNNKQMTEIALMAFAHYYGLWCQ